MAGWADAGGTFFDHFYLAGETSSACGDVTRTGAEAVTTNASTDVQCPACAYIIELIATGPVIAGVAT